jgi:RNA polymerase sigma-70 factor (ECF subfamily)
MRRIRTISRGLPKEQVLMARQSLNERLSRISTLWTVLFEAHRGEGETATAAQRELMQLYSGAVYRYLLGAVRDEDVAHDLAQDFAVKFLRGDFQRADPERGRFRDYLKRALIHLATDYHRAQQQWPKALPPDSPAPVALVPDSEEEFLMSWRAELLDRTWNALADANASYHAVLLFKVENPEVPSATEAEQLAARLGKSLTADWVRKTRQRAHNKFADLLIEEVAASLGDATPAVLAQELRELDLLKYCQSALERRQTS